MPTLFADEEETRLFLNHLKGMALPGSPNKYYFQIQSREKYGGINQIFIRKLVSLEQIIEEVHQATPLFGFFTDNGDPVPHDSLGVYMTPEPRNEIQAKKEVCAHYMRKKSGKSLLPSLLLSECQKNPFEKRILDIDVDDKHKESAARMLMKQLEIEPTFCLETRGGFHFLCYDVLPEVKTAVKTLSDEIGDIDLLENSMIPLPGSLQGGFAVKWLGV